MYETINSPINYGGLELKNRIIFAPTTFGLAEDEYFEKIRKIAAGGCAMVIIGDVPVGKSQFEKSLFDKKGFAYTAVPVSNEWVVPWSKEGLIDSCATTLTSYGVNPDLELIGRHVEAFREASGKYVERTKYSIEMILWQNS